MDSLVTALSAALLMRLSLVGYGEWQDRAMAVKFTDVDYYVFTDAAEFMTKSLSPYLRATYRYTPLVAWLLQPNIFWTPLFGKLVFILFDVGTGVLVYWILRDKGFSSRTASLCSYLWLFNPLPATVSSRGNAESIMSFLVLLCLKLLSNGSVVLTAVVYALSVHIKIYSVTYALPIYIFLGRKRLSSQMSVKQILRSLLPNRDRLVFAAAAGTVLGFLTGIFYYWYGWDFLVETYLYHITRRDIRHNFSVYFYLLYLTSEWEGSLWLSLLVFLPQFILLIAMSVKFYDNPPLCWLVNTMAFVAFNKVCTSQYFLWYLSLLPLVIPSIQLTRMRAGVTVCLWFLGQGLWLLPAYLLEFEGQNTFLYIWAAGLLFFMINIYILTVIIENHVGVSWIKDHIETRPDYKRKPLH